MMAGWQQNEEIVVAALAISTGLGALLKAFVAVAKAYKAAAPLRRAAEPAKWVDRSGLPPTAQQHIQQQWADIQNRVSRYAADINLIVNPLRKDTIDIVKEAANWGWLGNNK